jgi:hypothetical protein
MEVENKNGDEARNGRIGGGGGRGGRNEREVWKGKW